ncbi:MAG: 50S ribosomal protein L19e [Candidatus Pacearchaeota archaeon]|jgi:large subunit ribosomal protein L19e
MNLESKKKLAAKTLNVGLERIKFNVSRLDEIKEAITKQDIRDLHHDGAITIKEVKGRKAKVEKKTRRRGGKVRKKIRNRKKNYVIITRKLRTYIKELRDQEKIDKEKHTNLSKKIKMKEFKSKRQLKDHLKI